MRMRAPKYMKQSMGASIDSYLSLHISDYSEFHYWEREPQVRELWERIGDEHDIYWSIEKNGYSK